MASEFLIEGVTSPKKRLKMLEVVGAQRGDLVALKKRLYRNNDLYIFDGEKVIELNYDIDDYGAIPLEFNTSEFPIGYWNKTKNYVLSEHNKPQRIKFDQKHNGLQHGDHANIYITRAIFNKMKSALKSTAKNIKQVRVLVNIDGQHIKLEFDRNMIFRVGDTIFAMKIEDETVKKQAYVWRMMKPRPLLRLSTYMKKFNAEVGSDDESIFTNSSDEPLNDELSDASSSVE